MKTRLILGLLLVLFSVQTMGMGHPHNLFAARKLVKAKAILVAPAGPNAGKKHKSATAVNTPAGQHPPAGYVSGLVRRSFTVRCLLALLFTGQPVGVYWAIGQ